MRAVGAGTLVLIERCRDALGARLVGALADELGAVGVEVLRTFCDALVDIPKQRFDPSDAFLVHVVSLCRLPFVERARAAAGCAATVHGVWPPQVEEVAAVFRSAGIEARLEELALGENEFPGAAARATAYDCDGRLVVALVPVDAAVERRKLGCVYARPVEAPPFPFRGATVTIERSLLNERTVWLEAGSPRHAVGLSPAQLARIVHAQPADLLAD